MIKILIGAGHGGKDPGGGSCKNFLEKDMTLQISLYQKERLESLGFTIKLIREKDEYVSLQDRVKMSEQFKPDIYVSNHINAGGGDGAEVIHSMYSDGKLANLMATEIKKEGQNIRRVFSRKHPSLDSDYYYLNRKTKCETIIVEYGFADSNGDDIEQLSMYWKDYAEAVVESICLYFEVDYFKPTIIPSWKTEGINKLSERGVINNRDYWHERLDEELPAWAIFNILSRILG